MTSRLRQHARSIWEAGVRAASPAPLVGRAIQIVDDHLVFMDRAIPLDRWRSIALVGAGKAAAGMARTLVDLLEPRLGEGQTLSGCVAVPEPLAGMDGSVELVGTRPAGLNRPTADGVRAAGRVLAIASGLEEPDLLIAVFSGGGSALLPSPAAGISLADLVCVTGLLDEAGVDIVGINAVRKHLSTIKGGGLVRATRAGTIIGLYLSDVVGDPLDVIASGPTVPDPTTFARALSVLDEAGLIDHPDLPGAVRERLEFGAAGRVEETLKQLPDHVSNVVVGGPADALEGATAQAAALGYHVVDLGTSLEGSPREVAELLAGAAVSARDHGEPAPAPLCIVSSGEAPLRLRDDHGRGGRNQHLALELLVALGPESIRDVAALSAGTDGEDGPTPAAGAFVDEEGVRRVLHAGLDPRSFRDRQDSHSLFEQAGALYAPGLTGTNVADLRVVLVGPAPNA